jgi:hypothetical protein
MAKYTLTKLGRKDLANPKDWARSSSSLKLVETLQRRGDVEALRPTKLIKTKLASWIRLKWVKKSESKREKPARSKAKKSRVSKPAPAKPTGTLLQMANKQVA